MHKDISKLQYYIVNENGDGDIFVGNFSKRDAPKLHKRYAEHLCELDDSSIAFSIELSLLVADYICSID